MNSKRILTIGAGYAGTTVVRDIQNGRHNGTAVVVLDDNTNCLHSSILRIMMLDDSSRYQKKI